MPKLSQPYVDFDAQYLIVMSPDHHMRQLGRSYVWEYRTTTPITVGSSIYLQVITPSATQVTELAWRPSIVSTDQLFLSEFYESPTVTDGTTPCLITNQSRGSSLTANTIIYSNPTAVSGGTLLRGRYTGSGTNAKPVEIGADSVELGWHLKPSTKYVVKLTNVGQQATTFFALNGQFFEVVRDPKW